MRITRNRGAAAPWICASINGSTHMLDRLIMALALLAACVANTFAAETRSAVAGEPRPAVALADLGWLAGAWLGDGIYGPAREVYSSIMGGAIVGHFSQQRGDGIAFYELVLIRQEGESLTYCLKHFNADLTGWEEKDQVQCYPLIAREGDAFYFDGLTIRRDGPDGMVAAVRASGGGGEREYVFRYRREAPASGASANRP
jgi:hypothetical protein